MTNKEVISAAIDSIYANVVIGRPDLSLRPSEMRLVLWALDLLRKAIGVKTAFEIKHGYVPEFELTASRRIE